MEFLCPLLANFTYYDSPTTFKDLHFLAPIIIMFSQICLFWQTIATFLGVSGGFKLIHSSSNPRSCLYDPTAILTAEGMPTANSKGGSPIPFEENAALVGPWL